MPTATWNTWKPSAIPPPACRSATPRSNLKAAIAGETHEYTDMYPGMAKQARDEGFEEIADWFETLAKAERSHANRFQKALDTLCKSHRASRRAAALRSVELRTLAGHGWRAGIAIRRSHLAGQRPGPQRLACSQRAIQRVRKKSAPPAAREGSLEAPTRHPIAWKNPST